MLENVNIKDKNGTLIMSEPFKLKVTDHQKKIRLDQYISSSLKGLSRSKVKKLISDRSILVNGAHCKAGQPVIPGQEIEIHFKAIENFSEDVTYQALNIIYEDDWILVVNKPPGLIVHPVNYHQQGTLVNFLKQYLGHGANAKIHIVHRIDKDTSGILVVPKTFKAFQILYEQINNHTIHRCYNAIILGAPEKEKGTVNAPIIDTKKNGVRHRVVNMDGKHAITEYTVVEKFRNFSLVDIILYTGRTHQIRIHMAHLGHPVLGDERYGQRYPFLPCLTREVRAYLLEPVQRQMLHAKNIGFTHPQNNDHISFDAPLPPDMIEVLKRLREVDC